MAKHTSNNVFRETRAISSIFGSVWENKTTLTQYEFGNMPGLIATVKELIINAIEPV